MSGPKRIYLRNYPYFITTKTRHNRKIFAVDENAEILFSSIYHLRESKEYYLLGFVIMPDHLHLLISITGEKNVSQIMQSIKGYTSWRINREINNKQALWQKSFYDYILDSEEKLLTKLRYIHNNPVRKGLVMEEKEYKYSSAFHWNPTDLELFLSGQT
jgi:putative transposase